MELACAATCTAAHTRGRSHGWPSLLHAAGRSAPPSPGRRAARLRGPHGMQDKRNPLGSVRGRWTPPPPLLLAGAAAFQLKGPREPVSGQVPSRRPALCRLQDKTTRGLSCPCPQTPASARPRRAHAPSLLAQQGGRRRKCGIRTHRLCWQPHHV